MCQTAKKKLFFGFELNRRDHFLFHGKIMEKSKFENKNPAGATPKAHLLVTVFANCQDHDAYPFPGATKARAVVSISVNHDGLCLGGLRGS